MVNSEQVNADWGNIRNKIGDDPLFVYVIKESK